MEPFAPQNAPLEFRDVTISFDDHVVLSDVSFTLERGQILAITGCSGSGKSILLHAAIGFLRPDSGEILVEGRHIESLDEDELLQLRSRKMGMVFQDDTLFTGLTAFENAAYRLVEHGWDDDQTERATMEILGFVGLDRDRDKLPEELSIGMRRRLGIARALVGWPPVMLFDEPTAGLDPMTAKRILDLLIRARDIQKISALYVTKELHEIPYLAEHFARPLVDGAIEILTGTNPEIPALKVLVLERGRNVFFGSPSEFDAADLPAVLEMTHPEAMAESRRKREHFEGVLNRI